MQMLDLAEVFENWELLIWVCATILAIVVESCTMALVAIWFVCGAVAAAIANSLGASLTVQTVVFFVVSIVMMVILKPLRDNIKNGKGKEMDSVQGNMCILTDKPDKHGNAMVKYKGVKWNASILEYSNDKEYEIDSEMVVINIKGNTVVVAPKHN